MIDEIDNYDCYTDGSYDKDLNKVKWGFVLINNDKITHESVGSIVNHSWCEGKNITGEVAAVVSAAKYADSLGVKLNLFYDYIGIYNWVSDLFSATKPWKCNREYTVHYRNRIIEYKHVFNKFTHVKSHSGVKWNEYVDKLVGRI